ncbi:MAG: hypothetical protein IT480_05360 [Gammaproteobacteria bacterium]|nr:hypothetical protein [Gammaproteobacteria bacterium]
MAMSLRYSHLAPDQRREAVARLDERPVLSVSLQLPSSTQRLEQRVPVQAAWVPRLASIRESADLKLRLYAQRPLSDWRWKTRHLVRVARAPGQFCAYSALTGPALLSGVARNILI